MNTRSKQNDSNYFERYIIAHEQVIAEGIDDVNAGNVAEKQILKFKGFLGAAYLHLSIAKYSSGKPVLEMKEDLQQAISLASESWEYPTGANTSAFYFDNYPDLLWMVSIARLLKFEENHLDGLRKIVSNAKQQDWLLQLLFSSDGGLPESDIPLTFATPYGNLKRAILEDSIALRGQMFHDYLDKSWYPGHKSCYWHDNHLGRHDTYFGYWSFETAAVVNILGIDDSSFRDSPYYPKDLV